MNYEMLREIVAVRPKSFLLVGFLVVLNLALFSYLSSWQRPELQRVQSAWFEKREKQSVGQSPAVGNRYAENQRDLALFQKRLIPKPEFAAFLSRLFETAKGDHLAMKGMSYTPTVVKEQPGVVSYQLAFSVDGSYASIKRFIADLSRYPEAVTLDSVTLGNNSQTSEMVGLQVRVTVYLKMEGA
jgi:Tfp pilus assembly protein PilO